ncbi:MAG TPA: hypothetical protein VKU19_23525 [Bryobacteraceae bacterium]|nr:hypothetical protein [Bryobacteraceae bacterium]
MTPLEKVHAELARYEHALLAFSAREHQGTIELVIELRDRGLGLHTYYAPIHARDIEHPQFPWTFQRYLYDCMHDYLVEMFIYTPQSLDRPS